jgi:hypothetical protein
LSLALRLSGGTLGLAIWDPWHIILIAALKWIRIMGYMILIYTDHWEFTRFFWKKGATLVCSNELSRSSRWKQLQTPPSCGAVLGIFGAGFLFALVPQIEAQGPGKWLRWWCGLHSQE